MSQENVEVARRAYAAYEQRGVEGLLPFADEEIEIDEAPEFPDTGRFRGHDGIRKLNALFTENFDELRMEPEEFIDGTEDRVVVALTLTGIAKASRIRTEVGSFHVHTICNGKSVRMRVFHNRDAALEAAGLRK